MSFLSYSLSSSYFKSLRVLIIFDTNKKSSNIYAHNADCYSISSFLNKDAKVVILLYEVNISIKSCNILISKLARLF